jgi:excinuclease ABC subunit C
MVFADQPDLFPADIPARCLRYDIANCLGPCAGLCSRTEYGANVRAAKAFLDGRDRTVLKELTKRMTAAAADLRYEQATAVRDRLQLLARLDDRLTFLRNARSTGSFVYPLAGPDGTTVWYLIHRGDVRAAIREPRDEAALAVAAALIEATFAEPAPGDGLTPRTADSVLLVAAWFRRSPAEKAKLLNRHAALTSGTVVEPAA